jgi:hypothetical protein
MIFKKLKITTYLFIVIIAVSFILFSGLVCSIFAGTPSNSMAGLIGRWNFNVASQCKDSTRNIADPANIVNIIWGKSPYGMSARTSGQTGDGIYIPYNIIQVPDFITVVVRIKASHELIYTGGQDSQCYACLATNGNSIYHFGTFEDNQPDEMDRWHYNGVVTSNGWGDQQRSGFTGTNNSQTVAGHYSSDYDAGEPFAYPNDNKWHTLCFTYDGTRCWIRQGSNKIIVEQGYNISAYTNHTAIIKPSNATYFLLLSYWEGGYGGQCRDEVDEILLFNRALTKAEFARIHYSYEAYGQQSN